MGESSSAKETPTVLAAFNYNEPPFHIVMLGTGGIIVLMILFGIMRRIVLGMLGGGLGAAAIAWYVLGKGGGELVPLMQVIGAATGGVLGAFACGLAGFLGKWVGRNPKT
jgi:hypothetical protein